MKTQQVICHRRLENRLVPPWTHAEHTAFPSAPTSDAVRALVLEMAGERRSPQHAAREMRAVPLGPAALTSTCSHAAALPADHGGIPPFPPHIPPRPPRAVLLDGPWCLSHTRFPHPHLCSWPRELWAEPALSGLRGTLPFLCSRLEAAHRSPLRR